MQKTKQAFTLVELIVVITILAILGTIAFISLQGYSKKARDSKRTADISNIKVSLELFSLNTGYYPLPDNGEEVLYDNDLLWTQGIVGDNVTTNLSRNLLKKPTDPLHDIEYIYSLASSKKEYEVMSVYEGDLVNNSLVNSTYASDKYSVKVEGNYNELFVKTSKYIFPVPSIITSATIPLDFDLVPSAIESQVITGGNNFPGLNIPNTETNTGALKMNLSVYSGSINKNSIDDVKKAVVEKIQLAYSGSDIETVGVYKTLLAKTTDDELLNFVDDVVLNKTSSVVTETSDTEAPTGGSFSMDSGTNSVDITLTITCPVENGIEMYIDGDITNTQVWETCNTSKDVTLISGDGNKNISIKFKDIDGNESDIIISNIEKVTLQDYDFVCNYGISVSNPSELKSHLTSGTYVCHIGNNSNHKLVLKRNSNSFALYSGTGNNYENTYWTTTNGGTTRSTYTGIGNERSYYANVFPTSIENGNKLHHMGNGSGICGTDTVVSNNGNWLCTTRGDNSGTNFGDNTVVASKYYTP